MRTETMTGPELHPWNEDFRCRDHDGPFRALTDDRAVHEQPEKPRRFRWHQDNGSALVRPHRGKF